jgi:hypothetical protein
VKWSTIFPRGRVGCWLFDASCCWSERDDFFSVGYATKFISNGGGSGQAITAEHHPTDPAGWTRGIVGAGGFTYAGCGNRYPALAPAPAETHGHCLNHRQTFETGNAVIMSKGPEQ